MNTPTRALILAILALAGPAFAQQPVDPKDVPESIRKAEEERRKNAAAKAAAEANAAFPAKPIERPVPTIRSTDPDVQALARLLTGTFASQASGETPALTLSTAVITVEGGPVDNAVYFEIARADSPWAPFRQGVWQVWKKNGSLNVRQFEFADLPSTFGQSIVGLWASPDMFPVLKPGNLQPVADIALTSAGGNYSGSGNGPTLRQGAFEFTSSWLLTPEALTFTDRGTDIAGKQVWGPAAGTSGPTFKRTAPAIKAERRSGGVVVIDYVPPTPTERKVEDGSDISATLIGYTDLGVEFYNSSSPRPGTTTTEPFRWTNTLEAPPRANGFQGLNIGMIGDTQGTIRRIYVPSALGFGPIRSGSVQPNSDLIFTVQTRWVSEPKAAPQTPAPGPAVPGAPVPVPTPQTKPAN